jgi:hypothetical protein
VSRARAAALRAAGRRRSGAVESRGARLGWRAVTGARSGAGVRDRRKKKGGRERKERKRERKKRKGKGKMRKKKNKEKGKRKIGKG